MDFPAFLDRALEDFGHGLHQAYQGFLAQQLEERRQLKDEVAQLQTQLQAANPFTSRTELLARPQLPPLQEVLPASSAVAQPPPAARISPFLKQLAPAVQPWTEVQAARTHTEVPASEVALQVESPLSSRASPPTPECRRDDAALSREAPRATPLVIQVASEKASTVERIGSEARRFRVRMEMDPTHTRSRDGMTMTSGSTVAGSFSYRPAYVVQRRVQSRLGHLRSRGIIKGRELHQTLSALGLEKYTVKDMNNLFARVGVAVGLRFHQIDPRSTPLGSGLLSPAGCYSPTGGGKVGLDPLQVRSGSPAMMPISTSRSGSAGLELGEASAWAEWQWPEEAELHSVVCRRPPGPLGDVTLEEPEGLAEKVIPLRLLMEIFLKDEMVLEKLLGPSLTDQLFAIREVLMTGEANRLISELTFVRVDDLATRRRRVEPSMILDLVVCAAICLNGVVVGIEVDRTFATWEGWSWIEAVFNIFFVVEILARHALEGHRTYLCGPDCLWNWFDILLTAVGALGSVLQFFGASLGPSPAVLRFVRVARVSRLVRVFRLKFMLELRLMVKGVLSGMRTLFWAFVLLAFVLYALGVLAATLFQNAEEAPVQELFCNVPTAMFTTFRCVVGDCFTMSGSSLSGALHKLYGMPFAISFIAIYMLITLGLFNVILAIYVDVTMVAAKQTEDANKGRHEWECIRVAQTTKRLLKMFCAAYRFYYSLGSADKQTVDIRSLLGSATTEDVEIDDDIYISKELFLLVLQAPEVQKLMDDLDIPPDRNELFDSIDADGSGRLQATELVRGFLKVRGGVKKTDQIACILVLRSIQATLRQMGETMDDHSRVLEILKEGGNVKPRAAAM